MRRFPGSSLLPAVVLLALAACSASAPPARLYSLMPAEPAARDASRTPIAIALEPIRVPAQVDQPQWLVRLPDDSLAVLEQERWASPLGDELRQALLEELAARYGAVEGRATGAASVLRVGVDLRRFDSIPGLEARIEATWTVAASGGAAPLLRCEALLREPAAAGMPALAASHRRAVVRLADAIGESLLATRGTAPVCPAPARP
jgi:uncharacterized lipoprotein YmbA